MGHVHEVIYDVNNDVHTIYEGQKGVLVPDYELLEKFIAEVNVHEILYDLRPEIIITKYEVAQPSRARLPEDHNCQEHLELSSRTYSNGVINIWECCSICGRAGRAIKKDSLPELQKSQLQQWHKKKKWERYHLERRKRTKHHWEKCDALWQEWRNEYMHSDTWRAKRWLIKERAKNNCEMCFRKPVNNTHHVTYVNVGQEPPEDLQGLCVNCHEYLHRFPAWERVNFAVFFTHYLRRNNMYVDRSRFYPQLESGCLPGSECVTVEEALENERIAIANGEKPTWRYYADRFARKSAIG
jgi:hypothetical protein